MGGKYATPAVSLGDASAIRSWENNWEEPSTFFDFPSAIRRMIYITNTIEGYNRQLRKVIKNKASFPTVQSVRKILHLANIHITKKWTKPMFSWAVILNQLAIRFGDRLHYELPWQLLDDCNLRLAGFKGVRTYQQKETRNALDPSCGSGIFPRSAARKDVCEGARYTIFLTLLPESFCLK